jgi:entericidin B
MKNKSLPLIAFVTLLFGTALVTSGCNTMEGAGRDVERGGEAIQDAAR